MGILLVYDVTDERSFNNIRNWIRNTEQFASDDVNMILVGNKCDMADKRAVDRERAEALAAEYGMAFMETSAKASIGVDDAFMTIARYVCVYFELCLHAGTLRRGSLTRATRLRTRGARASR